MNRDVGQVGLAILHTTLGWVGMAASEAGLRHLTLPRETEGEARAELQQAGPEGKWLPEGELAELEDSLRRYFAGEPVDFGSIPLDLPSGTAFQRAAWTACQSIPRGEVRTYRWLAETVGSPRASRAIGQAMAANPIPIVIPCHRVVGADGSLTGFGGGLDMKARLLELEKRDYPTTSARRS
jgi:O-6-methylguanine DNA methyltransferase